MLIDFTGKLTSGLTVKRNEGSVSTSCKLIDIDNGAHVDINIVDDETMAKYLYEQSLAGEYFHVTGIVMSATSLDLFGIIGTLKKMNLAVDVQTIEHVEAPTQEKSEVEA